MSKEIVLRMNADGVFEIQKEPYMMIECSSKEDFELLKVAVDKQMKRKPKSIPCAVGKSLFDCPYCEKTMSYKQYHYCPDCGQKLDWGENDG